MEIETKLKEEDNKLSNSENKNNSSINKIALWFLLISLILSLYYSNKSYQKGYDLGSSKGYSNGHTDGYETGYDLGYDKGYDEGYSTGYDEGYNENPEIVSSTNEKPNEPRFDMGVWNGDIYECKLFNIGFKLNDYWSIYSDEKNIQTSFEANKLYLDALVNDTKALDTYSQISSTYGFSAETTNNLAFISTQYNTVPNNMSLEQYMDFDNFTASKVLGSRLTLVEEGTIDLADKTFNYTKHSQSNQIYLESYYYKQGNNIIGISIGYTPEMESAKHDFLNGINTLQ